MGEFVEYRCRACARSFTRRLEDVVSLVRKNRTRCTMCGGGLVFPEEIGAAGRALDTVGAPREKLKVACPVCARTVSGDRHAGASLTCTFCSVRFLAPMAKGEPPRLGSCDEPDSTDSVFAATAPLGQEAVDLAAKLALRARAERREVNEGEAPAVVRVLAALAEWEPRASGAPFLPLSVAEASEVIPRLFFRSEAAHIERSGGRPELVVTVSADARIVFLAQAKWAAVETVKMFAAQAAYGNKLGPGGQLREGEFGRARKLAPRVRVRMTPVRAGVELGLAHQIGDAPPTTLGDREHARLRDELAARRESLRAYYALVAVFGPAVRGAPAFAATSVAIDTRLRFLGGELADRAARLAPALLVKV